jgi:hypothetical protein
VLLGTEAGVSICGDKAKEDGHTNANETKPATLHSYKKFGDMREMIPEDAYTTMAATMRCQLSHQRGKSLVSDLY